MSFFASSMSNWFHFKKMDFFSKSNKNLIRILFDFESFSFDSLGSCTFLIYIWNWIEEFNSSWSIGNFSETWKRSKPSHNFCHVDKELWSAGPERLPWGHHTSTSTKHKNFSLFAISTFSLRPRACLKNAVLVLENVQRRGSSSWSDEDSSLVAHRDEWRNTKTFLSGSAHCWFKDVLVLLLNFETSSSLSLTR